MVMKSIRTLIATLAAAMLLASCQGDKVVFEGKIIGYNGEYTEFFLVNPEGEGYIEVPFDINPDGTFSAELEFARSEFDARLFIDKFMFCTCVEQGQKYYAEFDITQEGVETNFRFIGNGASENEFTRDYWSTFGFDYAFLENAAEVKDFAAYMAMVNSTADNFKARMEEMGNEGFTEYYTAIIDEAVGRYSLYFPYLYLSQTGQMPQDKEYEDFLASGYFEGYTDEQFSTLFNRVSSVVSGLDLDLCKALKIAEKTSENTNWNHFLMTSILINRLQVMGPDGMEEAYGYYRSVVTEEGYVNQIAPNYEAATCLASGAQAPQIEMEDADGKKFTLADFKGKALYIDFWASWCKPCCEEIPYLQKIVTELGADKDIQVISISIDEDSRSWKKRLEEENPTWPQYIATEAGLKAGSEQYQINGIPRFILLDRQGRIITVNAPRPSTLTAQSLKELLAK